VNPERRYFAHSLEGRPEAEWQLLRDHLEAVGELAAGFGEAFGAAEWGRVAGLWHDLGKYRAEFQDYIRGNEAAAQHAVVGALLAQARGGRPERWLPLAFVIAGHHGGLGDLQAGSRPLMSRLKDNRQMLESALAAVPEDLRSPDLPPVPERLGSPPGEGRLAAERMRRSFELWTRFLFSTLVDADFLDTEDFYHRGRRAVATSDFDTIPALRLRVDQHVDDLVARAEPSAVNELRAEVLEACRSAAELPPGIFSLNVPTGGGKTLSAMAFALRHAELHGLDRVVAVIPYTSIIEQNAAVYCRALGERNVIEHHSNLDPEEESRRNKLASENWDAPVIVTTSVQFFESLFANRPSRCRKVHNVARSVILLDEVQTLPAAFLLPILDVLRELTRHYGCSVVLSTATQPALERRETFEQGLESVHPIVEPRRLARRLRRFDVEWPDPEATPATWEKLAAELARHRRVLAIVHRRQDGRDLARLLPEEGLFHLSALLCPAHRSAVLRQVLETLENDRPCRLVSTQLVEAGVDVDFPVVYRALGGLDSLTQAGGRCNREGSLERGRLVVFRAPTDPPPGTPARGLETMISLLRHQGGTADLADPDLVETYFRWLYQKENLDAKGIQAERQQLNFATVSRRFRLIEDGFSRPVVVPYGDSARRLERFRDDPGRDTLRGLQPYVVNLPVWQLERLREASAVEEIHQTVVAVARGYHHLYDRSRFGLVIGDEIRADPKSFIA
jgi:CRISPR-associated endonuclease/helicase Cas3